MASFLETCSFCMGASLLVVLTSSFNFVLMMYDDGQLHVLVFDLLFMGFLMAAFFIVDSSQLFSIALKEEFVMIGYY